MCDCFNKKKITEKHGFQNTYLIAHETISLKKSTLKHKYIYHQN